MKKLLRLNLAIKIFIIIGFCLADASLVLTAEQKASVTKKLGLAPELKNELLAIGVNPDDFLRDEYDFYGGDFTVYVKLRDAILSDKLFKKNPEVHQLYKNMINRLTVMPMPWRTIGQAKLVEQDDNVLAELRCAGEGIATAISRFIVFKNFRAKIKFDFFIIKRSSSAIFEVVIKDSSLRQESSPPREIIIASHKLITLPLEKYFTIYLSDSAEAKKAFSERDNRRFEVFFQLKDTASSESIIQLDNFRVVY